MRNLELNKSKFSYLNYKGNDAVTDESGNFTGEKQIRYSTLKTMKAHISGAKGSSMIEVFGTDISYDKTILLTKSEFIQSGINENSVFFIDKKAEYKDGVPIYDYRVRRIAQTVNEVLIAVVKVGNNG